MFAPSPFAFGAQILAVSSQTFQTPLTSPHRARSLFYLQARGLNFALSSRGLAHDSWVPFRSHVAKHGWSQNFGRTHFAETQVHILGTPAPSTASAAAHDAYRPAASYSRLVQEANPRPLVRPTCQLVRAASPNRSVPPLMCALSSLLHLLLLQAHCRFQISYCIEALVAICYTLPATDRSSKPRFIPRSVGFC